jgi:ABC-type tungstate transport system substrate-binding protein
MDPKTAVLCYQFAEKAKSELIISSQLCIALSGFPEQERAGGKRMLIHLLEAVRNELRFAYTSTNVSEFNRAINAIGEAISLVESGQPENASQRIASAITASTTPAQNAWQVLNEHGLL